MTAHLLLISDSLCSKWGFNDGDMPDEVWDLIEGLDIPYAEVDWHEVLRRLVRDHLLPALAEHHQVEVYDIETIHNPIRASVIDGREIDDYVGWISPPMLAPEWVLVPMDVVAAAVRDATPAAAVNVVEGEVVSSRWGLADTPRELPPA